MAQKRRQRDKVDPSLRCPPRPSVPQIVKPISGSSAFLHSSIMGVVPLGWTVIHPQLWNQSLPLNERIGDLSLNYICFQAFWDSFERSASREFSRPVDWLALFYFPL
jgi:hypothetical protein